MPNSFSRFAAYLSVLILVISVAGFEWVPWYIYFTMTSIIVLLFYNFYLFFKQIYVTKNWHVEKSLTRALGKLSGLYVGAGMAAFMTFANFNPEFKDVEGFKQITRLQILFGYVFFFFGGIFMFYYMAFGMKFILRYLTWPKIFKF